MSLYLKSLVKSITFELLARILAPVLPIFAKREFGKIDNANGEAVEPRLTGRLSGFMTPDNSLWGDKGWQTIHCPNYKDYWSQVKWLWRNPAYGYKWNTLACEVKQADIKWIGNLDINRNQGGIFGELKITMGDYWQWKSVKPIPKTKMCVMLNFGWLLDSYCKDPELYKTQPKALFMFSPRIVKVKA